MRAVWNRLVTIVLIAALALPGCSLRRRQPDCEFDPDLARFHDQASKIEYPDVDSESYDEVASTPRPADNQFHGDARVLGYDAGRGDSDRTPQFASVCAILAASSFSRRAM